MNYGITVWNIYSETCHGQISQEKLLSAYYYNEINYT